ncbi:regulating synaptic membrane exocytosis protein 2-like isoform X3 [Gordionus sp. m RMFG-2023]|uniref:regulating synaptic membrane exocytosis protein 2-like isoform X3 n=1 Tax=Gordionus sp. m RMFG-2023 TaxID=3053472 RepID=UPI0031FCA94B
MLKMMSGMPINLTLPDLSHLTDEEKKIIQNVIQRQKIEEEKETKIRKSSLSQTRSSKKIPGFFSNPTSPSRDFKQSAMSLTSKLPLELGASHLVSLFRPSSKADPASSLPFSPSSFTLPQSITNNTNLPLPYSASTSGNSHRRMRIISIAEFGKKPHRKSSDTGALCDVCGKTKFVDGAGHLCSYCKRLSCARCGGKVPLKPSSPQSIWVCLGCRKKHQSVTKTGDWLEKVSTTESTQNPEGSSRGSLTDTSISVPFLSNTPSRNGSSGHHLSSTPSHLGLNNFNNLSFSSSPTPPLFSDDSARDQDSRRDFNKDFNRHNATNASDLEVTPKANGINHNYEGNALLDSCSNTVNYYGNDHNVEENEGRSIVPNVSPALATPRVNIMLSDAEGVSRQTLNDNDVYGYDEHREEEADGERLLCHSRSTSSFNKHQQLQRRRKKLASSNIVHSPKSSPSRTEPGMVTPTVQINNSVDFNLSDPEVSSNDKIIAVSSETLCPNARNRTNSVEGFPYIPKEDNNHLKPLEKTYLTDDRLKSKIRGFDARPSLGNQRVPRYDSLSSEQSEEPHRVKSNAHHIRKYKPLPGQNNDSMHSPRGGQFIEPYYGREAEEEDYDIKSTPLSSCDDGDKETESLLSLSERELPNSHSSPNRKQQRITEFPDSYLSPTTPCQMKSKRYEQEAKLESLNSNGQDLNLAKNNNMHSVEWMPSPNGTEMLGRIILYKPITTSSYEATGTNKVLNNLLGLKIIGGQEVPSYLPSARWRKSAIVDKVKRGSLADTVARLRPGDEIISWNGHLLRDKSYEEVSQIISKSKQEFKVTFLVSRPIHSLVVSEPRSDRRIENNVPESYLDFNLKYRRKFIHNNRGYNARPSSNLSPIFSPPKLSGLSTATAYQPAFQSSDWVNVPGVLSVEFLLSPDQSDPGLCSFGMRIISAKDLYSSSTSSSFSLPSSVTITAQDANLGIPFVKIYFSCQGKEPIEFSTKAANQYSAVSRSCIWDQAFNAGIHEFQELCHSASVHFVIFTTATANNLSIPKFDEGEQNPFLVLGEAFVKIRSLNLKLGVRDKVILDLPLFIHASVYHDTRTRNARTLMSHPTNMTGGYYSDREDLRTAYSYRKENPPETEYVDKSSRSDETGRIFYRSISDYEEDLPSSAQHSSLTYKPPINDPRHSAKQIIDARLLGTSPHFFDETAPNGRKWSSIGNLEYRPSLRGYAHFTETSKVPDRRPLRHESSLSGDERIRSEYPSYLSPSYVAFYGRNYDNPNIHSFLPPRHQKYSDHFSYAFHRTNPPHVLDSSNDRREEFYRRMLPRIPLPAPRRYLETHKPQKSFDSSEIFRFHHYPETLYNPQKSFDSSENNYDLQRLCPPASPQIARIRGNHPLNYSTPNYYISSGDERADYHSDTCYHNQYRSPDAGPSIFSDSETANINTKSADQKRKILPRVMPAISNNRLQSPEITRKNGEESKASRTPEKPPSKYVENLDKSPVIVADDNDERQTSENDALKVSAKIQRKPSIGDMVNAALFKIVKRSNSTSHIPPQDLAGDVEKPEKPNTLSKKKSKEIVSPKSDKSSKKSPNKPKIATDTKKHGAIISKKSENGKNPNPATLLKNDKGNTLPQNGVDKSKLQSSPKIPNNLVTTSSVSGGVGSSKNLRKAVLLKQASKDSYDKGRLSISSGSGNVSSSSKMTSSLILPTTPTPPPSLASSSKQYPKSSASSTSSKMSVTSRPTSTKSPDSPLPSTSDNQIEAPNPHKCSPPGDASDLPYDSFIEGLGPAQIVGMQMLTSPALGDVQVSLQNVKKPASVLNIYSFATNSPSTTSKYPNHESEKLSAQEDGKGLEVEVIRARGLVSKPHAKVLPAPYVKLYLLEGKRCVAKAKTSVARRTLDPLYQQQLVFDQDYRGKILQITVWGEYSKLERKSFMGVCQIRLDHLGLDKGAVVIAWYKLFNNTPSLSSQSANAPVSNVGGLFSGLSSEIAKKSKDKDRDEKKSRRRGGDKESNKQSLNRQRSLSSIERS